MGKRATAMQRFAAREVCRGEKSVAQIAADLGITPRAVYYRLRGLKRRTGVSVRLLPGRVKRPRFGQLMSWAA